MAKRPSAEELHEQTMESRVELKVASRHISDANEGLSALLATYEETSDDGK